MLSIHDIVVVDSTLTYNSFQCEPFFIHWGLNNMLHTLRPSKRRETGFKDFNHISYVRSFYYIVVELLTMVMIKLTTNTQLNKRNHKLRKYLIFFHEYCYYWVCLYMDVFSSFILCFLFMIGVWLYNHSTLILLIHRNSKLWFS